MKRNLKAEQLIEVAWDISSPQTREREIRGLLKAADELSLSEVLIITEEEETSAAIKGIRITFTPLWKWLLAEGKPHTKIT
ncbi:hypothetical protein A3J44_06105 [candidate division WOR-1 bacterium RIFCSPHIGHO2_02_FULL_45_12]|nr:MAG: hypothetical protein A3J44_06105 [candidate division WOR-1 bacterium RIFCSPHIGHO2_02_FULL_45_12]